jgi:hypothetical protein
MTLAESVSPRKMWLDSQRYVQTGHIDSYLRLLIDFFAATGRCVI